MLQQLLIENYAIIDKINLKLNEGLNIVTGETGAGKSIIMGALGLILGNRADNSVLKHNEGKCIIEAVFKISNNEEIIAQIDKYDLDKPDNDELIIRREISSTGKSRSFINDTPVNLAQLKDISSFLVDQHQQFDNLMLGSVLFQHKILDTLAKNSQKLNAYKKSFSAWTETKLYLAELLKQKEEFTKEYDYLQFQATEFQEINLKENELEELDNELKLLSGSGEVKTILSKIYFHLYENEESLTKILKDLGNELDDYNLNDQISDLIQRIKSAEIDLKDLAQESENVNHKLIFDEERLAYVNERLATGYRLLKKHNAISTQELLEIYSELNKKLQNVLNIDEKIAETEKHTKELYNNCFALATEISKGRKRQVAFVENNTNDLLHKIGMPNATLKIGMSSYNELTYNGLDNIDFLFDANKTGNFDSVNKVASGGELSRLMLCLKSLVAKSVQLPTLIFDEIDTGISGEAARQVGNIMQELAGNIQVISITHQPQIASKADAHYYVYKKENERNEINTQIRLLNTDERVLQIAQMLSGANPSEAALNNAKELLEKSN